MIQDFLPTYFQTWHLPVVFLAGMIGEGYAVLIGSGGILIQFVLLSLGMPLPVVIATDIAGCLGTSGGVITASPKHIWANKKLLWILGIPFTIGGIIGTIFLTKISAYLLTYILIIGLIILLGYMVFGKKVITQPVHEVNVKPKQVSLISGVMATLGVYTNVSGVGSGTFMKVVFSNLLRLTVADGIGISQIIFLPATIFSFILTAIVGLIAWPYLITLWVGTFIGSHLMAKQIRKIPDIYLRFMLSILTLTYLIYLIWSVAN